MKAIDYLNQGFNYFKNAMILEMNQEAVSLNEEDATIIRDVIANGKNLPKEYQAIIPIHFSIQKEIEKIDNLGIGSGSEIQQLRNSFILNLLQKL